MIPDEKVFEQLLIVDISSNDGDESLHGKPELTEEYVNSSGDDNNLLAQQ